MLKKIVLFLIIVLTLPGAASATPLEPDEWTTPEPPRCCTLADFAAIAFDGDATPEMVISGVGAPFDMYDLQPSTRVFFGLEPLAGITRLELQEFCNQQCGAQHYEIPVAWSEFREMEW